METLHHLWESLNDFLSKFWLWLFNVNLAAFTASVIEIVPTTLTITTAILALWAAYVRLKKERTSLQIEEVKLMHARMEGTNNQLDEINKDN